MIKNTDKIKNTKGIIVLLLILACHTNIKAQSAADKKFMVSIDSLNTLMHTELNKHNYQSAEEFCREMINLYDLQASQLSEVYAYFKYLGYYNMACLQAKQGKNKEAVANLVKVLDSGKMEISYNQIMNNVDLSGILDEKILQSALKRLKANTDYLQILKDAPEYSNTSQNGDMPRIIYERADNPDLVLVREYFKLDSVAVKGDEISTIKRILTYIHDKIRHDGQHGTPSGGANSLNYAEACKDGSRGLNCRGLATVLNECYLSMGIPSRVITCLPKTYIVDCHVINAVYSSTLKKWLWIDPTNNAWVTDDRGNMLSVQEVRDRLRSDLPVLVNKDANWNNEMKTTTEAYLYEYMAKNLFYIESWTRYGFNTESDKDNPVNYIFLQPAGCKSDQMKPKNISVNDDQLYWQAP